MTNEEHQNILILVRRMGTLMEEFHTASLQLSQSLDRNDTVSIKISLEMRQEAIQSIQKTKQALAKQINLLPESTDRERLKDILNGGESGESAAEQALSERAAANIRLYQRILRLDEVISRKMARERSVYAKQE